MDWITLIQSNTNALIGLGGVVVGTLLGAMLTYLTQARQRRWALDDQRREWKRQRRKEQCNSILAWSDQWLRLANRIREAEETFWQAKASHHRMPREQMARLTDQLEEERSILTAHAATIGPIIGALNDTLLTQLCNDLKELRSRYRNILLSQNFKEEVKANKLLIDKISDTITKIHQRADALIEETFSSK